MSYKKYGASTSEIITVQDVVDRMEIIHGLRSTGREENALLMSVIDALRELPSKHDWAYYQRALQVTTEAPTTGLVGVYDHTGGANERQVTLTTGTWPANAELGQIVLLNNLFKVDQRISDTIVTLSEDSNPGRDVSSSSMTWVRTSYNLGQRVRRVRSCAEANTDIPLDYVNQNDLIRHQRVNPSPSTPIFYNIHQTGGMMSEIEVEFSPPPLDARSYILSVEAQPRPIRTYAYPVEFSGSGSTVTAALQVFKDYHVGSVFRTSIVDAAAPTGLTGALTGSNVFTEQFIIKKVNSATQITLDGSLAESYTEAQSIITDPIDIDPVALFEYFFALCNRKFAMYSPNLTNLDQFIAMERNALRTAIGNNNYVHTDALSPSPRMAMTELDFILSYPITETED